MTVVPNGWVEAILDDVCQIVRGITFPTNEKRFEPGAGLIACLRTANVQATVEWDDLWFVPRHYVKNDAQLVLLDDILISTANSYELVGKVSRVTHTKFASSLGAFISLLRAYKGIDPRFLYYQMSSESVQRSIREMSSTTTNISNVSGAKLKTLGLHLAPAAEQTRIVAKLEELLSDLDAGVAELKAAQKKLQQFRQSLLKAAVKGALTASWRETQRAANTPLETGAGLLERILRERRARWEEKQLAKFKEQGKTPPKDWQKKYPEPVAPDTIGLPALPEGWVWASVDQLSPDDLANGRSVPTADAGAKVLRLTAIKNGMVDLQGYKLGSWSEEDAKPFAVTEGDLLIVRGNGSLHLVGRAGLVGSVEEQVAYPDTMIRLRVVESVVSPAWIGLVWESHVVRAHLERRARTSAGIYKIAQPDIVSAVVPIPSLLEQAQIREAFALQLAQIAATQAALETSLKQSTAQRQNILRAAFSGQLVPQDPDDEPASVLLERTRSERAAQAATKKPRGRKTEGAAA